MTRATQRPIDYFDDHIPSGFLEETIRTLQACYGRSFSECYSRYPSDVAHDVQPLVRCAEFETSWKMVAQGFGMQASYERNAANNCNHLRITCGSIVLTQSFVDPRVRSVRRAMFRDSYAQPNEAYLFRDMAPTPKPSDPLYAILMHDVDPTELSRPLYIDIGFPASNGRIVYRIQLANRYASLFAAFNFGPPEEVVADSLDLGLRDDVRQRDAQ